MEGRELSAAQLARFERDNKFLHFSIAVARDVLSRENAAKRTVVARVNEWADVNDAEDGAFSVCEGIGHKCTVHPRRYEARAKSAEWSCVYAGRSCRLLGGCSGICAFSSL